MVIHDTSETSTVMLICIHQILGYSKVVWVFASDVMSWIPNNVSAGLLWYYVAWTLDRDFKCSRDGLKMARSILKKTSKNHRYIMNTKGDN